MKEIMKGSVCHSSRHRRVHIGAPRWEEGTRGSEVVAVLCVEFSITIGHADIIPGRCVKKDTSVAGDIVRFFKYTTWERHSCICFVWRIRRLRDGMDILAVGWTCRCLAYRQPGSQVWLVRRSQDKTGWAEIRPTLSDVRLGEGPTMLTTNVIDIRDISKATRHSLG
ncbi:hypothetical protein CPB85DRAFT_1346558 [Mucidula mucida]|nr:hypothetical protein CPB85DRAFT_1346558 [Mucidula mucida]